MGRIFGFLLCVLALAWGVSAVHPFGAMKGLMPGPGVDLRIGLGRYLPVWINRPYTVPPAKEGRKPTITQPTIALPAAENPMVSGKKDSVNPDIFNYDLSVLPPIGGVDQDLKK